VEEVLKGLKSPRSLEAYQGGFTRSWKAKAPAKEGAQPHHLAVGLVADLMVERERLDQHGPWWQRKRRLILQASQAALPALERVRAAA
jgi:hypothetical protein